MSNDISNNLGFRVTLSRTYGSDETAPMRLCIEDRASHCRVLETDFSLEQFAELLTSRHIDTTGLLYSGPIGCTPENKTEKVLRPNLTRNEAKAEKVLAPFEVDGWRAHTDDLWNHHRSIGEGMQIVNFTRYIRPDGTVWEPNTSRE